MAIPVKMLRLSKVATTAEIIEWLKSPGEPVREGEPLLRVLSEKATVEVEAPASGILLRVLVPAGKEVPVGTLLAWIGQPGETPETSAPAEMAQASVAAAREAERRPSPEPAAPAGKIKAAPAARRLAAEHGINLAEVAGSGPDGMIMPSDVERIIEQRSQGAGEQRGERAGMPEISLPPLEEAVGPEMRIEPLTGIQRVMMQRMTMNRQTVAQATTVAEADVSEIMGLRATVPATLTAWVILAAVRALREYPILNASLRADGIAYHEHVHVGVSVETDAGLMVPVIHNAQQMTLSQIQRELSRLVEAARTGTLAPSDVEGATFTVTNSGVLGSVLYTPMIVPPQSAILGMGRAAKTPVVRDEQVVIRTMMYLCLSYDHRFIAGGIAVRYLQRVRAYLENPVSLVWDAGA